MDVDKSEPSSSIKAEPVSDDDVDARLSDSDGECGGSECEQSEEEDADLEANPPTWRSPTSSCMRNLQFAKEELFLIPLPSERQPIHFFNLLVDQHFLEHIVIATNQNAIEVFCDPSTTQASRITRWNDVTVEELKVFIGLLLHMGIVQLPGLCDYWKRNKLFVSCFPNFMSRDRFLLILRCIDFNTERVPSNKVDKIKFLVDYFNNKLAEVYYPGKNLCIDEPTVLWRRRLYSSQEKYTSGIKLYSLCEPQGLILRWYVSCSAADDISTNRNGHTQNVVFKLLEGKLDHGHSVYMTDYYNSVSLASALLRRQTYCTGHLRLDRKYISDEVKSAKLKKKETICRITDGGVSIGKWRNENVVPYITTEFENQMAVSCNNVGGERVEPKPIAMYNNFMRESSRGDLMTVHYPCDKIALRWDRKVFVHVLQMLLLNAYYLYDKVSKGETRKVYLYDFRLAVIDSLLPSQPARPRPPHPREFRHVPRKIEERKGNTNRRKQKRCRACSAVGVQKRVVWHCEACEGQPGLCVPGCFDDYHK